MRLLPATVVAVSLLAAVSAAGGAVFSPGAAGLAALRLVDASPVVVSGSGFAPRAHVTVVFRSGGQVLRRSAVAGGNGTFRATFPLTFDRCKGATLQALTALRTTVTLTLLPCSAPGGRPRLFGGLGGVLRGAGFLPHEGFTVVGKVGDGSVKVAGTADANGSFVVRLNLPKTPCAELFFDAVGTLGSEAKLSLPAPNCKSP